MPRLQKALETDLGDHFTFQVQKVTELQEDTQGHRVYVRAALGPTLYAAFHIDVVNQSSLTAPPESVPPLVPIAIDGLVRPPYRTVALVDHLADKLCATIRRHDQPGETIRSTRVKDLVDIALIARSQAIDGETLRIAVVAGLAHQGLELPSHFAVPDETLWRGSYGRVAAQAPPPAPSFDDAVRLASALLDPALAGPLDASWDPKTCAWLEVRDKQRGR